MPLTPIQSELRLLLEGYLAGERPLDEFRSWEVALDGSDELGPADAAIVGRLALIADTVVSGAADEPAFAEAARSAVRQLEAIPAPA